MLKEVETKIKAWVILIALVLTWGSSFILIKRGLESFSMDEVGALRIVITFIFLLPMAISRIARVPKRYWLYLALIGIIGSAIPPFLFAKAQTGISSYLAGVLNSVTPLFTLVLGGLFFKLRIRWFHTLGVLAGLVGAVGLIIATGVNITGFNPYLALLIIIAAFCYAVNVNLVKRYLKEIDAITITAFSFFIIGFPVTIYLLFFTDFPHQITHEPEALKGLGYITILAILGTGVALIAFNNLIKISSPVFAASVTYMIPIVAIFWGVIDGEPFEWVYLLWMGLILGGVFLVNKTRSEKRMVIVKKKVLRQKSKI
ncbi:MAG: EamA family transporter [Bacteroidales bacterium]|nr:EamA family transporter [Bacteroidales bacterium]